MSEKQRLDILVVNAGLTPSREKARGMIMAQEIMVNGEVIDKPGTRFNDNVVITMKSKPRFVSRGGNCRF
jgi:23S rRNA (cytidine1920-2'-O)/16S rRNA (cytidine1409-2'-O)-methyltransferase